MNTAGIVTEKADFMLVLGDELRKARRRRRWTRKQLQERLNPPVALPTLASYEMGMRHCSVNRFIEICEALEASPPAILANALRRAAAAAPTGCLDIDLRPVVSDDGRTLRAFRRWAQQRLAATPGAEPDIRLEAPTVKRLADLCNLTAPDLVARLTALGAINSNGPDTADN